MTTVDIDNRALFYQALAKGINLFTGAGFSVLPSPSGNFLPTVSNLLPEICSEFAINTSFSNDIEKVASILKLRNKGPFDKYLREKYTVSDYNPLYNVLNKVNIHSFITTNIDNLFPSVIDNSKKYYLNSSATHGAAKRDGMLIEFTPLHGYVKDLDSELYFGKFELNIVGQINRSLFESAKTDMMRFPTLFWGYGFHDGSVLNALADVISSKQQDIWVQCRPNDDIDYYRALGLNVIIADTESLLRDIEANMEDGDEDTSTSQSLDDNSVWMQFKIPTLNAVESLSVDAYYTRGITHWYYILSDQAYVTELVSTVMNCSLEHKNVVLVGIPFCGKTTLLMQIAQRDRRTTYFIDRPTLDQAKLLIRNIKPDQKAVLLIDNCAEDMRAYALLANQPNILTIATSDESVFEQSKHLLSARIERINFDDLSELEAQSIYNFIPEKFRKDKFTYKENSTDKYSMLEFMSSNISDALTEDRIHEMLQRAKNADEISFELILLTTYLMKNKSALSTDVLFYYLGDTSYDEILKYLEKVAGYLNELDLHLYPDADDQDYFSLRSNLFAYYSDRVLQKYYKKDYGSVVARLIHEVPSSCIYRYFVFKRTAFDSEFFYKLYGTDAESLYNEIYGFDPSGYTLQQRARYKSKCGDFQDAFVDIDKASVKLSDNFSIKNTKAIILFEANKGKKSSEAIKALHEAMLTLGDCYRSDKRKAYHARVFAEFAIYLADEYRDSQYLEQAQTWLESVINKGEYTSHHARWLLGQLRQRQLE